MEAFIGICNDFKIFLMYKGTERRVNFPRKIAMIFAAEVIEIFKIIERSYGGPDEDNKLKRCCKLCVALSSLAESCKGRDGIEAFAETLQIIIELFAEMKKQHERINELISQLQICSATIKMLELEPKTSTVVNSTKLSSCERVDDTSEGESRPLINPLHKLKELEISSNYRSESLYRKLEVIRSLLSKSQFEYVQDISSGDGLNVELYYAKYGKEKYSEALSKEIDLIRTFLIGYNVICLVYEEAQEL